MMSDSQYSPLLPRKASNQEFQNSSVEILAPRDSTQRRSLLEVIQFKVVCSHKWDFPPYEKDPVTSLLLWLQKKIEDILPPTPRKTIQENANKTPIFFMKMLKPNPILEVLSIDT
ncbi:hypothetical protein STEG23_030985 [Scotinomys teguina]